MSNPYRGKRAIERGGRRTVLVFCALPSQIILPDPTISMFLRLRLKNSACVPVIRSKAKYVRRKTMNVILR